ncbi:MAG: tetratricopeptide repeat protein [Acidobacteriota bacterium]|nr:tetratricopeptide repeat protein [Acidobacteriota bacterium]
MIQARLDRNADADPIPAKLYDIGNENEINNLDYGFLFQLQDPDRAIEIFARNVPASPKSWNAHDSLAEAYAAKGDKDEARKHYKHALEMAPEAQHSRIEGVLGGLGD